MRVNMTATHDEKPVAQLREILALLSTAVEQLACEWESRLGTGICHAELENVGSNVTHAEYKTVKTVLAAVGSLESLIVEPHAHLFSMATSYTIARALHVAAENNVAEVLAGAGEGGLRAAELATSTGIEEKKLSK
jgi:hypothetical protein